MKINTVSKGESGEGRRINLEFRINIYTFAQLLQSCPTLCNPMDCSLLDSSVHGIPQARILEWVAISSSRGSSPPRDRTHGSYISCIDRQVFITSAIWEAHIHTAAAKSLQSCPTLCDPIDISPPGFPVPGILQARTLEWVAISFSNA